MPFERTPKRGPNKALGPGVFLSVQEFELFWLLCYAAMNGKMTVPLHKDHVAMARDLEPRLYALVKELDPSWNHPLRERQ